LTKTFRYFPPLKYILSIPLGLFGGIMFTWITFIMPEWYVKIFTILFAIILFGYAYGFYSISFRNKKGFKVKVERNFIRLPFLIDKKNVQINLKDIVKVELLEDYIGKTIAIYSLSNNGFIELEKKWMKKDDFNDLFHFLKNKVSTQLKFKNSYGA